MEKGIIAKKSTAIIVLMVMILNLVCVVNPSYAITSNDTTAKLYVDRFQDGGPESSGILQDLDEYYRNMYDQTRYAYKIGTQGIYKIRVDGAENDKSALYCIEQHKEFPGLNAGSVTFTNKGNFLNSDNQAVRDYINDMISAHQANEKHYEALVQMLKLMYLKNQAPEQKEAFLRKVYKPYLDNGKFEFDVIKTLLTDDDIDVVQQYAIWFYTEASEETVSNYYDQFYVSDVINGLSNIYLEAINRYINNDDETASIDPADVISREDLMNRLYTYLIVSTLPYAKGDDVGAIPEDGYETTATIWTPEDSRYQRVILVERKPNQKADLALRKFIAAVSHDIEIGDNDYLTGSKSREPVVDITKLDSGEGGRTTAIYKQSKEPVEVEPGDYILYTIRIYNEGPVDAKAAEIVDYLPDGLEMVPGATSDLPEGTQASLINTIWDYDAETGKVSTNENYHPEIVSAHVKGQELSFKSVQILCRVKANATATSNFLNLAEIKKIKDSNDKEIPDKDSEPNNAVYPENPDSYDGGESPDKSDEYKPGQQDDDDFDKVKLKSDFDLALRKFIVAVSKDEKIDDGEWLTTTGTIEGKYDREPSVDTSKLNTIGTDGKKITTAIYNHPKNPVKVAKGDTVVYTIRVYNEGDVSGYANKVTDYLPEYLEFLPEHEINTSAGWKQDSSNSQKISTDALSKEKEKTIIGVPADYTPEKYPYYTASTNLLLAYNSQYMKDGPHYRDVRVVCKVKDNAVTNKNITNIAEITAAIDERGNNVTDRDSETNNLNYPSDPSKYEGGTDNDKNDNYIPGQQDDDDFDRVIIEEEPTPEKIYDLALKKFISAVSKDDKFETSEYLTGDKSMAPTVDYKKLDDGTSKDATYTMKKTSVNVEKTNYILYTIRIYNEGPEDAKATEVTDILPEGLDFVANHSDNSIWTYNSGNRKVVTNDKYKPEVIKGHEKGKDLSYVDLKVVCQVSNNAATGKDLKNVAEITKETDKDGNPVKDRDSTPGNYNPNGKDNQEDDDDYSKVIIKEEPVPEKVYDLALRKFISAVSKDSNFESNEYLTGDKSMAPTVDYKKLDDGSSKDATYTMKKTSVNVERSNYILYTIRIFNEGPEDAMATEIVDILPEGLDFVSDHTANSIWTYDSKTRKVTTNKSYKPTVIKAHEKGKDLSYVDVFIICRVSDSATNGKDLKNVAEITKETDKDGNPVKDRDSTPGNYDQNGKNNQEDDDDYALINVLKTEVPTTPTTPVTPTTPSSNPPASTPSTGDTVPMAAAFIITIVGLANVFQIAIGKYIED